METKQLEQELRVLDDRTTQLAQQLRLFQAEAQRLRAEASSLRAQAESLMQQAYSAMDDEDGGGGGYALVARAEAYFAQADALDQQADEKESQMDDVRASLRGCCSRYEGYKRMGEENIRNLQAAASKLSGVGGRFGRSQIEATLGSVRNRLSYNQKLAEGCETRISWINRL